MTVKIKRKAQLLKDLVDRQVVGCVECGYTMMSDSPNAFCLEGNVMCKDCLPKEAK